MNQTSHPPLDAAARRPQPLDRARRAVRGVPDDHPRPDDRERGAAVDPDRPALLAVGLAWVVNAYLIAFGGLLLLVGRLGDLIGRRRIFLAGLTVFTIASLVCGLADSQGLLIGARFVQGVGGAMTSAVILGMIVTMFPQPSEQAKAIGVYSFVAAAGGAIGLLAGGVLTQAINWHWIFFVNLPIGIATGVLATGCCPDDAGIGLERGADAPGAVLLVTLADARRLHDRRGQRLRLGKLRTRWASAPLAVALLAAFVVRQATRRQSADAAAHLPLADGHGREPDAGADGRRASSACSSSARCTCSGCSATTRSRSGLAFLPVALGIAALSLGSRRG